MKNRSGEWWFGLGVVVVVLALVAWGIIGVSQNHRYSHDLRMEKTRACEHIVSTPDALTLCLKMVGS